MKKNKFKPNKHKWWDEPQSIKTIKQEIKNRLTGDPFRVSINELVDCVSKQMSNESIFEKSSQLKFWSVLPYLQIKTQWI